MAKILIVDDDKAVLKQLKEMAENRGYKVETAVDEDDAGAKIEKEKYDVVIADMKMKRDDSGVIVVKRVKEMYPLTQVIVLTAYGNIQNATECMEEGAFSYVEKNPPSGDPYKILFLKVEKALELREALIAKEGLLQGFINALATAIDLCDPYTHGHSKRVADISKIIAQEINCLPKKSRGNLYLSEENQKDAYLAGIIHDIGKIVVNPFILSKPTELNYGEFAMIKAHTEVGQEVIPKIPELKRLVEAVVQHHERYDGRTDLPKFNAYKGKPKRNKINIIASIISVADTYDALVSDRPYRKGMMKEEAKEIIEKEKRKQFNPKVVDAFVRAFNNGKIQEVYKK